MFSIVDSSGVREKGFIVHRIERVTPEDVFIRFKAPIRDITVTVEEKYGKVDSMVFKELHFIDLGKTVKTIMFEDERTWTKEGTPAQSAYVVFKPDQGKFLFATIIIKGRPGTKSRRTRKADV